MLAYGERGGIESEIERIPVSWERDEDIKVDPLIPATWRHRQQTESTKDSYAFLERLKRYGGNVLGLTITVGGEGGVKEWVELTTYEDKQIEPVLIEECLASLRKIQAEGQVKIETKALYFESGQGLLEFIEEMRTELQPGEVKQ